MDAAALEALIIRFATEPAIRSALVAALLQSKVAIPLDRGLVDGTLPPDFKPLTLNAQDGYPVLAVFTTPDKAAPWIKQQPAFQHVLVTGFDWAVGMTRPPFGLGVNPGYRYSLQLPPAEVEVLRAAR